MKEIRKLNLSEGQLLSFEQQDEIVAGKAIIVERIGDCQCSYSGPHMHVTRFIAYYCATDAEKAKGEFYYKMSDSARKQNQLDLADEYYNMAKELLKEYNVDLGFEVTYHTYDKNGKEISTEVHSYMN